VFNPLTGSESVRLLSRIIERSNGDRPALAELAEACGRLPLLLRAAAPDGPALLARATRRPRSDPRSPRPIACSPRSNSGCSGCWGSMPVTTFFAYAAAALLDGDADAHPALA
jgi:hypothetical protein